MWLERFSAQSGQLPAPGPPSRNSSFSPAPSRSIQLGPSSLPRRPGLSPRTSSLSFASIGGSTDSLPAAARVPNASNLRNEFAGVSAPGAPDPVQVLEDILGPLRQGGADGDAGAVERPATLVEDIDFGGLSLQDFVNTRPDHGGEEGATGQPPIVEDFEKEKDRFEDLHKSIQACDEVLESVETYLTSFQADLASVSNEIETLQNRSASLNNKLKNRKIVDKFLGPEVESLSLSPAIVRKITEGNVDESWVRAVEELEKRSKTIDVKIKEGKDIKAAQDMRPFVDEVSAKAVERIRDYVVAQIKALRSPSINAQIIQDNNFLKHKEIFAFLSKRQPELADEISQAYVYTMRWYYLSHFTRYKTALEKLNLHAIDQNDVLAAEVAAKKIGKAAMYDAFSVGRRGDILRISNENALPSFAAEEDKGAHFLEVPFRNFNLALVDNASAEFSFLTEFFSKQPYQVATRKFNEIFQPTFDLGHALTKQLTEQTLDALGVLVCVRLNQHLAFELQRRKNPAVEGYVNGTNMLLWPRFQIIMDAHCDSIRRATASLTGKPLTSALSLTSNTSAAQTTAPHPLTQRYASFLQGILALSSEAGDDEPVSNSVGRLRTDFEAFLTKMSKSIAEARKRDRFLYNNYALICTIIAETEGRLADELKGHYLERREASGSGA